MRLFWMAPLAVAWACEAGVNVWTGKGPDAGTVFRVSASPTDADTVYACGSAGYRVSTDGGTTWTPLDDAGLSPNARDCFELVATPNALYRCSGAYGCYRSPDSGASWSALPVGLGSGPSLAADSSGHTVLVADGFGVHRSTDSGLTWSKVLNAPAYSSGPRLVAFDPSDSSRAFVGGSSFTRYESTDAGATWSGVPHGGREFDFSFDPATSSGWCGVVSSSAIVESFISGSVSPPFLFGVSALHHGGSAFFAGTNRGIFYTSPDLASWNQPDPFHALWINSIDAALDGRIYAGSDGGLLRSSDAGATWTRHLIGPGSEAFSVAGDAASPETFYAGTSGGLFKTTDDGETWEALTSSFGYRAIDALASGPTAGTLFAAPHLAGLLKSTDGGGSWAAAGEAIQQGAIYFVAVSPVDDNNVWAVSDGGIFSSTDGGESWSPIIPATFGSPASLVPDPLGNGVYVGDDIAMLTLYTAGGRTTWPVPVDTVQAVAVAPSQPSTMYVGGPCCLALSTDGGGSWTVSNTVPKPLGLPYVTSIVVDPLDANRVWIGTASGVFLSSNAGESWVEAVAGLQSSQVNSLVASPANSRKLAAATSGAGGVSVRQIVPPGDITADGFVDVRDVFALINGLFAGGPGLPCLADVNVDGTIDAADVFYLINYLFAGGPAPQAWFGC